MTWRYQPVWVEAGDDFRGYTLAYVNVDAAGRLCNWVQTREQRPRGIGAVSDLTCDLARMLMDANLYKPVAFSSLKVGMVFERVEG